MKKYHQLFVTHCLTSDSVLGEAGFSIRATSLKSDDSLLSIAMNLNAYELPLMAYDGARPYPKEAPIRLAAIPLNEINLVAIMHSVYMETDTRGRPNSYFTHVIFVPKEEFSWRATLKSWGAIQWQMPDVTDNSDEIFNPPRWITQWPNHTTNELPMLESLPESGLEEHHFINELYKYYQKSPTSLEIILGNVLARLKKKSEQKNDAEPIRGYLLPRFKIKENQCEGYYPDDKLGEEEDNSFWPENSQFRFGENIRETLLHLSFIAWFFPEKLLNDQGFSTYEPNKYGVSIANDKLLVGIVHAKDENPDEMMTSQGIEYYSAEKKGSLSVDPSDDLFKWGKKQIDLLFKKKTLINFSKEIDQAFESFKKTDLDRYQKSKELFDAIKDYEQKTSFNTAYKLLTIAKTNNFALEKFKEKRDKALPDFIDACFKYHSEKKDGEFKSLLTLLTYSRFFDWVTVCKFLITENFWQISKKDNNLAARFSFLKSIMDNLKSESDRDQLKSYLKSFLFNDSCFQIWKTDEGWIWALFNFYYKINEKELAKNILSIASFDEASKSIFKQWKKNPSNNLVDWLKVLPWLMELSVKNGKGNKQFEELSKDAVFVLILVEITNTNTYKEWKKFFHLYETKSLEVLAKTSIDGKGMPLTSQLMKFLLNAENILPEEIVSNILFSGDAPRVFKIIGDGIQLPNWLSEKIEKFLERIDPEKLFSVNQTWNIKKDGKDYRTFPFENLLQELEKVNSHSASNFTLTEMLDRLNALVAIKKYESNVPDLFEIVEFEQNIKVLKNWGVNENPELRKVVIDYLATKVKVFEDEEGGYGKEHGKFILLLVSLNHPQSDECLDYLHEKSVFLFDIHFRFMPQILLEPGEESKTNLVFSMLKNKWIQKFTANKSMDSAFLKVKRKIGNRFRLNMPIAKVYDFLGGIFKGKSDEKYQNGRLIALVLFFFMFFIPPIWCMIFTGGNPMSTGYLTGFELIHDISFGLIALFWGYNDFFSKVNNLGKPEQYAKNMYSNWGMIGVGLWSIFGVGLSVFFYLSPKVGWPYGSILLIETLWFVVYMGVIYKDPLEFFLSPNVQVLDSTKK
jgi:hypothetical protein